MTSDAPVRWNVGDRVRIAPPWKMWQFGVVEYCGADGWTIVRFDDGNQACAGWANEFTAADERASLT